MTQRLQKALENYLRHHRIEGSTTATVKFYAKELRLFLDELDPGCQTLADLTSLHVLEHLGSMKDRGLRPRSIRTRWQSITTWINWRVAWSLVDSLLDLCPLQQLCRRSQAVHAVDAGHHRNQKKRDVDVEKEVSGLGLGYGGGNPTGLRRTPAGPEENSGPGRGDFAGHLPHLQTHLCGQHCETKHTPAVCPSHCGVVNSPDAGPLRGCDGGRAGGDRRLLRVQALRKAREPLHNSQYAGLRSLPSTIQRSFARWEFRQRLGDPPVGTVPELMPIDMTVPVMKTLACFAI